MPMNNNNTSAIDFKLQHLVNKIIKTFTSPQTTQQQSSSTRSHSSSSTNNSNNNSSLTLSSKQIFDTLTTKHREYTRKNSSTLQTIIDEILISYAKSKKLRTKICSKSGSLVVVVVLGGSGPSSNNHNHNHTTTSSNRKSVTVPIGNQVNQNNSIVGNKRKRNEETQLQKKLQQNQNLDSPSSQDISGNNTPNNTSKYYNNKEDFEYEYDIAATKQDTIQSSSSGSSSGGGSMLNANLRNRYKDVQRERDVITRKKVIEEEKKAAVAAAAAAAAMKEKEDEKNNDNDDCDMNETNDESKEKNGNDSKEKDDSLSLSSSTTTPSNITHTTTPKPTPSKRRKKKISKSSSNTTTTTNGGYYDNHTPEQTQFMTSPTPRPKERYSDLGGLSKTLQQIRQLIEYPLSHPELFSHLGIHPPRGVLLRGPPGCGKTHIANAIAGQLNVTFFKISAPEIVSSMSGESESRLRDLFSIASSSAPSIIFMDEIDAIAPKRGGDSSSGGGGKGMEKRIVAQLLTCMDSLTPENNRNGSPVMVLAATNRPDSIDSALRRAGRFDREIVLGVPDEEARMSIIKVMTDGMRLCGDIDFKLLAKKTPGFVGADIRSLTKEAGVIAINRIFKKVLIPANQDEDESTQNSCDVGEEGNANETASIVPDKTTTTTTTSDAFDFDINNVTPFSSEQLEPLFITMDDFLKALPNVQPSSKREGFATVPDVTWDKIGALECVREELTLSVLEPITHPEKFKALGLPLPAGVLLYGPPGCGKTLLAKAIANESGANFISVKGPELLDKYVGESERAVRQVFERARSSSPCIVFFDELDSLCPKRGSDSSGGGVSERVVNQLLTEMDGLDSRKSIFVIAATNRPELIDPAMLRPGRLDKLLYVPLPTPKDRVSILKANAKNVKLALDVDLDGIAMSSRAEGYSGADCAALLREAGLAVLRDNVGEDLESPMSLEIKASHFDYAFNHVMPSVSKKDQARYDKMRDRMARARTRGTLSDEKATQSDTAANKNE